MTTAFQVQPRLDGFMDWLRKKKPPASEMTPAEPGKASKFDVFRKEPKPEEEPSKFDPFRTEEEKTQRALIPRPEQPVVPEAPRSEFAMFAPEAPSNVPAVFRAFVPKPPAPADIPKGFEIFSPEAPQQVPAVFQAFIPQPPSEVVPKEFEIFIPTPEERALAEETYEEKEIRQMELWKDLFPTSQEEEKDIFKDFARPPSELVVSERVQGDLFPYMAVHPYAEGETISSEEIAEDWEIAIDKVNILPLPPRADVIPSAEEVARAIVTYWGHEYLEEIWNDIRRLYDDPDWVQEVERYADACKDGDCYDDEIPKHQIAMVSTVESYHHHHLDETAALFGISRGEIEEIGEYKEYEDPKYGDTGDYENQDALYELHYELEGVFQDAMEMLKPADIPGHVILEHDSDWDGSLCINYVDFGERFVKTEVTEEDVLDPYRGTPMEAAIKEYEFGHKSEEGEEEEEEEEEFEEAPVAKPKKAKAKPKKAKKSKKGKK